MSGYSKHLGEVEDATKGICNSLWNRKVGRSVFAGESTMEVSQRRISLLEAKQRKETFIDGVKSPFAL
uniref:Transposase n=1 Tax=Steinernema glaseri TaxID=37863 RepID=A0A1I8A2W9_9BILA